MKHRRDATELKPTPQSGMERGDKKPAFCPRDKFAADASARLFRRIDLAASVVWVGERLDRDYSVTPSETVTLAGYVLIDVVLAAPLGRGFELFVRADNILDARYEAVFGYGAPGRAFRTGIRFAL